MELSAADVARAPSPAPAIGLCVTTKRVTIDGESGNEIRMGRDKEPEEYRQAWSQLRGCRAGVFRALRHFRRRTLSLRGRTTRHLGPAGRAFGGHSPCAAR